MTPVEANAIVEASDNYRELSAERAGPAWKRIVSEGHVIVARLNNATKYTSHAPRRMIYAAGAGLGAIALAALLYGGGQRLGAKVASWFQPSSPSADVVAAAQQSVLDLSEMIIAAGANGPAVAPPADLLQFVQSAAASLNANGKLPDNVELAQWPATGQPWPAEAILSKKAGDTIWLGARVKLSEYSDGLWIGVARQSGKTWSIYNLNADGLSRLNGLPTVSVADIPHAVSAAFGVQK
jgi:hypothetical protein